jgi:hypothetical protein
MDSWSAIQLKKMQAGGNADLNNFLKVRSDHTQKTKTKCQLPLSYFPSTFIRRSTRTEKPLSPPSIPARTGHNHTHTFLSSVAPMMI